MEALGKCKCFTEFQCSSLCQGQDKTISHLVQLHPALEAGASPLVPKHLLLTNAICGRRGPAPLPGSIYSLTRLALSPGGQVSLAGQLWKGQLRRWAWPCILWEPLWLLMLCLASGTPHPPPGHWHWHSSVPPSPGEIC